MPINGSGTVARGLTATGTLRFAPPGYVGGDPTQSSSFPGYTVLDVVSTTPQALNLTNGVDYYINMGTKSWSSGGGRTIGLEINGGRNVVLVGGEFNFTGTNNLDDSTAIMISDGSDGGTVHLEGLKIDCANGITVRTRRAVQIQNCRIRVRVFNDDPDTGAGIHPDIVQVWATNANVNGHAPCAAIRMHKVTGYTRYTGLVVLTEFSPPGVQVNPVRWDRYQCDIHPDQNNNGTFDAANYAYMCDGGTGSNNGPYTEYHGEVYAELPTGGGGAFQRKIDDIVCLRTLVGGLGVFPYEIKNAAGVNQYVSPDVPTGGNAPMGVAGPAGAGNYLTYDRIAKFVDHRWYIGQPPLAVGAIAEGDDNVFVLSTTPGPNYVSPRYIAQ